jgi:hypothetical protein
MKIFQSLNKKKAEQIKKNLSELTLRTILNSAERFLELCEEPSVVTAKCTKKKSILAKQLLLEWFFQDGSPTSAINI